VATSAEGVMRGRFGLIAVAVGVVVAAVPASASAPPGRAPAAPDYASVALNILPAGEYGDVPPGPEASSQAKMYDALTPRFDQVTEHDLATDFKSEALGTKDQGPLEEERKAPPGVRIIRDAHHVPHIFGTTHDAVIQGAGWVLAEDRHLLLEQARYDARVAAIDAPGLDGLSLIAGLKQFAPSDQTEREVARQTTVLEAAGPEGRAVLHDIDQYTAGINAYYRSAGIKAAPWTRRDIYALNALKGQFVGEGGGAEARNAMLLDALRRQLGPEKGDEVFEDLREANDPETPASVPGSVAFQPPPRSRAGNVVIDAGSYVPVEPGSPLPASIQPTTASNALLVSGSRTADGHPLMVAGPQIGYFYPGLLLEMDLEGPGIHARGSTSAPFPGYILIGRNQDSAWSLTSAGLDIIDTYAETLCGGSDTKYMFDGRCRDMDRFDAGTLNGTTPISFYRTVHGPVIGYATVGGTRVALSRKRSSYGRDTLDQLLFRDLTLGNVHDVHDFFRSANQTPQTFNSFYLDDRDIGVFTSGDVPLRPPDVDPALPTEGTGKHEWRGRIGFSQHPQGVDPPTGEIVNWNNKAQGGYRASDDNWSLGAIQRVQLLTDAMSAGKQTPASLTSAMNKAATQDVRLMKLWPVLEKVLGPGADPREQQIVQLLDQWRRDGGSRLDRDGDGSIDAPGAAILDAAWDGLARAWAMPVLGPLTDLFADAHSTFDAPPGGQYSGWHIYMEKDLRTLLGEHVQGAFQTHYCGGGDLEQCRASLWSAIDAATDSLTASQGADPSAWRASATAERIEFVPGLLSTTMAYTNRSSGIQQVIAFDGHRP
jgi:acyl-homoserine lactone acylase PvdQ